MRLRQLPAAVAASILVAELGHAAGFGSDHLLGGSAGTTVLGSGLAWAALLMILAALGVALEAPRGRTPATAVTDLAEALPGRGEIWTMAAAFAGGGGLIYCLLEASEGHSPLGSPLALSAILPLAAAVAGALRFLLAWIAKAGLSLAALGGRREPARERWSAPVRSSLLVAETASPRGRRRGRAPPSRAFAPHGA
jgi:hypothetical protein